MALSEGLLFRKAHRVAIANGRLVEMNARQATMERFSGREPAETITLDVVVFIRRYLLHVLPQGFVKIRHFGFLADRNRREALLLSHSFLSSLAAAPLDSLTETQRHAVERTGPICKIGTLHILDWILTGTFFPSDRKPVVDSSLSDARSGGICSRSAEQQQKCVPILVRKLLARSFATDWFR